MLQRGKPLKSAARSSMQSEGLESTGDLLNHLLQTAGMATLGAEESNRFNTYLSLFIRWNTQTNLSSVRDPQAIVSRHFVESIACARMLPAGVDTLLDFGSGGGLPGIPIAICRQDISVTLAESQGRKAAFLQEAVRMLGISASVFAGRAERLQSSFDCVVLRAVDKMAEAVRIGAQLVAAEGWLALMTTTEDAHTLQAAADEGFMWQPAQRLPMSDARILVLGRRPH